MKIDHLIFACVLLQMLISAAIGRVASHPGLHSHHKAVEEPVQKLLALSACHLVVQSQEL